MLRCLANSFNRFEVMAKTNQFYFVHLEIIWMSPVHLIPCHLKEALVNKYNVTRFNVAVHTDPFHRLTCFMLGEVNAFA